MPYDGAFGTAQQEKNHLLHTLVLNAPNGTRTHDFQFIRLAFYQLNYRCIIYYKKKFNF